MTVETTRQAVEHALRLAVTNRHITPAVEALALALLARAETAEAERDDMQADVARLWAAQGWQPIETAPKDGTRVMLWRGKPTCGEWSEMIIAEWRGFLWRWPDNREVPTTHGKWPEDDLMDGWACNAATHWMPLPTAPEEPIT